MKRTYPNQNDASLPQCIICKKKFNMLSVHLKREHKITKGEYAKKFNLDINDSSIFISSKTSKILSDLNKGEKNSWYNHRGKLSPFSLNNPKSTKDSISKIAKKARQTSIKNGNENTTITYYLKRGYSNQEAKEKLKERQTTFSLEKCIAKYGEKNGKQKWKDRQEKWQKTLTAKPEEEQDRINNDKVRKTGGHSNQSIELFSLLPYPDARWSKNGGELGVTIILDGKRRRKMPDFTLDNKIIEYFGSYWHADIRIYDNNKLIKHRGNPILASEIRKNDNIYITELIKLGYKVKIVWELDFKNNKQLVIQECIDFLNS
jgi:G:T-mismatch repair DNA endonuclease (very short patch repair protein)